jgi:DNA-binding NarL/FixJ family response regulator
MLVVDDHPLVRRGIVQVLSQEFVDSVVGEAANEGEAVAAVWSHPWDLVFLDISLPGRGGVEVLKEIKAARPKMGVLVVSSHPESHFAMRVLRAGASGYLTKDSPPAALTAAAHKILGGGKYISQSLAERMASELGADTSKPPHELLSDREYAVMMRIAAGQGVSKVAEALSLSVKTVSTYRTRILEKMALDSNADLTQYALRTQLIE